MNKRLIVGIVGLLIIFFLSWLGLGFAVSEKDIGVQEDPVVQNETEQPDEQTVIPTEDELEAQKNNQYEKEISELKNEVVFLKEELKKAKEELKKSSSQVAQLTNMVKELNEKKQKQLVKEVIQINKKKLSYEERLHVLKTSSVVEIFPYKKSPVTYDTDRSLIHMATSPKTDKEHLVCVWDDFTGTMEGTTKHHGEVVVDVLRTTYNGTIYAVDWSKKTNIGEVTFLLSNCDVVNFSFTNTFDEETVINQKMMLSVLDYFDTVIIASAGNDETVDVKDGNLFAQFKEEGYFANLLLISQGKIKEGKPIITQSGGTLVDYVVLNDELLYEGNIRFSGTSFAAPFVTGVVANLLDSGVKKEKIENYLYTGNEFSFEEIDYRPILLKEIYEKLK